MGSWNPKLLPRRTFNGRRVSQTLDEFNIPSEATVAFTVEQANAQPVTGHHLEVLPEGYRDRKVYKVYTTTPVYSAEEGTDQFSDEIEVLPGEWFKVIKVEAWQGYSLQSHYLAYMAEVNER
jgi:hypothetical protein